nr:hypothetical protein KitaXyl93_63360 [Kitasatospora sp. Xyl93]
MSLGYSCLAVANTLLMATAQRTADFAVLRLSGATRRQVLRMVAAESTLAVGIGTRVDLALPWSTTALTVGVCLLLALPAGVLPARSALRRPGARPAG